MTTHAATPWPDEESRLEAWTAAAAEMRGGDDYGELMRLQRLVQDHVAGATFPPDTMRSVIANLREISDLLAGHQVPEPQRWDGWRPDLPGRALPLLPPYVIDEMDSTSLRGRVTFTRFYLGGNGAAHGGSHTLLFDDAMGNLVGRQGAVARTAYLKVNFRRITPIGVELTYDVSLDGIEDRKRFVTARLRDPDGALLSDADALFLRLLPHQP